MVEAKSTYSDIQTWYQTIWKEKKWIQHKDFLSQLLVIRENQKNSYETHETNF